MSQSLARRSPWLTAAALALIAALPSAAHAADAPLRTIGVGPGGVVTTSITPFAVAPDGREVLGAMPSPGLQAQPVIRNVAAGTTTDFLSPGDLLQGTSTDLQEVLILTKRRVDPVRDQDDDYDLYVINRLMGKATLVSAVPGTNANPGIASDVTDYNAPVISGDGNVVQFYAQHIDFDPEIHSSHASGAEAFQFDVAKNTLTKITDLPADGLGLGYGIYNQSEAIDDAGKVAVNAAGVFANGKRFPIPGADARTLIDNWVSPDGSSVALSYWDTHTKQFSLIDTATGAVRVVKVPDWLTKTSWVVLGAANKGGGAILGTTLNRGQGPRYVIGSITPAGVVTQIGGDIPVTDSSTVSAVSQNLQFAASNLHLAQIGTTPLPGTDVPLPQNSTITGYVYLEDTFCATGFFGPVWYRGKAGTNSQPVGTDTRALLKSEWSVYDTATKKVINAFTLSGAGKQRELTVPRTGGYSALVKVTLAGGATLSGLITVPKHPIPECSPLIL